MEGRHRTQLGLEAASVEEPPFFFQKSSFDSLVDTLETESVPYPSRTSQLEFEAELVVGIVKSGRDIRLEDAAAFAGYYGVGCDLTRRDLQGLAKKNRRPWDAAKNFDFSAPCGPLLKIDHLPGDSILELKHNGAVKQSTTLDLMISTVAQCVASLSQEVSLHPGDLIFTGTPAGVGELKPGDDVLCTVSHGNNKDLILPPCRFIMAPALTSS